MVIPVNYTEPKKITTDFDKKLRRIQTNFYLLIILLSSSITLFSDLAKKKEELLISKWLFDETKLVATR